MFDSWKATWDYWPTDRLSAIIGRVGLVGVDGCSVGDCDPIYGSETDHTVTWHGSFHITLHEDQDVVIHFLLRGVEIYSLQWGE